MPSIPNDNQKLSTIAVIGNYLPRQCGIATFTTDLVENLSMESQEISTWVMAMNDKPDFYTYPEKVRFEINQNQLSDYSTAAQFLNISQVNIVCVQHEYGLFGGPAGSYLLKLLADLRMPVVTTLHTVLKEPPKEYHEVMCKLSEVSDKLVVMSRKASTLLKDIYAVPEDKIVFIHHGIPDLPFTDTSFYKDRFNLEGKKVLLTFGLISPNKGIETVLQALPEVISQHPDLAYIILGATHPHVLNTSGNGYRLKLQKLVHQLKIGEHVLFHNRFVELEELCEFLGMADIYITPYLNEAQITSGTLAYAMGSGKAIISTPYWYATEMLAEDRGRIVPFNNPEAMVEQITDLLDNETKRQAMRKKAYIFTRKAIWKEVAREYLKVFDEVQMDRARKPCPRNADVKNIKRKKSSELPNIKLDHMKTLTDDTGILQHASHTIPDRIHGYCTDDNARALLVAAMSQKYLPGKGSGPGFLRDNYLGFLLFAYNEKNGRFRNFMTYSRRWTEEAGSEDSHGRAIWCLGKGIDIINAPGSLAVSTALFKKALNAVESFQAVRAVAFSLVGIHAYLHKFSGDSDVCRIQTVLAERLFNQFKINCTDDWPWPEDTLSYANGKLPHALMLSGSQMQRDDMVAMGLNSLKWLVAIQTEGNHFTPVGNTDWYEKGKLKSRFDQQPIEAATMTEACVEAFNLTRDHTWFDNAVMCFNWFLGHNDLNVSLYDPKTGGCRDGLEADGANQNQGAESCLAWLLSLVTLHKLYAHEILKPAVVLRTDE